MEARKSFVDASISGRKDRPEPEMDPPMLTTFLETCVAQQKGCKGAEGTHKQMHWDYTRIMAGSPEARKEQDANRKGNEIDHANWGI